VRSQGGATRLAAEGASFYNAPFLTRTVTVNDPVAIRWANNFAKS
jgi:hypothetical protein